MYKSDVKSLKVIGTLAIISLIILIVVENSKVSEKQKWYEEKMQAAQLMQLCEKTIKEHRLEKGIFIDPVNDPNQTLLIGQEQTLITTDWGNLDAKLTALNPNFAAVLVDMMKRAGLKEGDQIAVAFTGSMPAMNIAVLCAAQVMELNPNIITSVGASMWGANDPDFTWLDMEKLLYDKKILEFRSVAASIGGSDDIGKGLSPMGRELIVDAIKRNDVIFINESNLQASIDRRLAIYDSLSSNRKLKAYVNVGGGLGSLGANINKKFIRPGLNKEVMLRNFPVKGAALSVALRGVPLIHILEIEELARREGYELPISPEPLPEPGDGKVFVEEKYNVWIAGISLLALSALIFSVVIVDARRHKLKR